MVETQMLWLAGVGGALIGLVLGVVWGRSRSRGDANRVLELEEQLRLAEADHATYRSQVSGHFVETSRRLHDLTLQYKSVYEHLADGARTLCPEAGRLLPGSFAEAALPAASAGGGVAAAESEHDAQRATELENADEWHEHADEESPSTVEPVLDERIEEDLDEFDELRAAASDTRAR